MVKRIKILLEENNQKKSWYKAVDKGNKNSLFICGYSFIKENIFVKERFAEFLLNSFDSVDRQALESHLINALKMLNGFFAIIYQRDKICIAIVDRVRSIPLFYRMTSDTFYNEINLNYCPK